MIGKWIARFRGLVQETKVHFVESVIDGDIVTNCGKRIDVRNGEFREVAPPDWSGDKAEVCGPCQ